MSLTVSETYQIITEKSAEAGDYDETGFNFEGREFGFRELVEYIQDNGFSQTSDWPARASSWLSTEEELNYRTGESTSKCLHFDGPATHVKYWRKALLVTGLLK